MGKSPWREPCRNTLHDVNMNCEGAYARARAFASAWRPPLLQPADSRPSYLLHLRLGQSMSCVHVKLSTHNRLDQRRRGFVGLVKINLQLPNTHAEAGSKHSCRSRLQTPSALPLHQRPLQSLINLKIEHATCVINVPKFVVPNWWIWYNVFP